MEIKVLGPGCSRCETTKKNVEEAVAESGINAEITKITNTLEIAFHKYFPPLITPSAKALMRAIPSYGVFGTPAVIVDGKVKCVGKIPTKDEIKEWIKC